MKDFEMSVTNDCVSCLAYSCRLSLAFIVLELFYNPVSYRKRVVLQMMIVIEMKMDCVLVQMHLIIDCHVNVDQFCICL